MRSSILDIDFYKNLCELTFGKDETGNYVWTDIERTNTFLGGLDLNVDHLIFTNGSEDPWKHASTLNSVNRKYKSI